MIYTLSLFNTGQITLPKAIREKFNTKKYLAIEQDDGILIKPLFVKTDDEVTNYWSDENVKFTENKNEWNVKFKKGISTKELIKTLKNG